MSAFPPVIYEYDGGAMLRATTRPGVAGLPRGGLGDAAVARAWLGGLWQDADVRDAVRVASPVLCQAVESLVSGAQKRPRQIQRTVLSVASYLLRWQHRATPFGGFAGIAPLSVGPTAQVRWHGPPRATARADAAWLAEVIRQLHSDIAVVERLSCVANDTAVVRGDRVVASGPPADGRAVLMAPVEVSVPARRTVLAALTAAAVPVSYRELREQMRGRFPNASDGQVDGLLGDLIAQHLLISSLWAPMTTVDALAHVCAELKRIGAHGLPGVGPLVHELDGIHAILSAEAPSSKVLVDAVPRMHAVCDRAVAPAPLLVDMTVDGHVQIPHSVVSEVQRAVAALYRVTPHPYGHKAWRDYHRRFRARYGVGAAVPVLDLIGDHGLGLPATYVGAEREKSIASWTNRDEWLLAHLQQVLMDGREELVLTDADVDELARVTGSEEPEFAPRLEVAFELHAASTRELARGRFDVWVTSVPRTTNSMAGRFAYLLPEADRDALARTYRPASEATVTAQLSFTPRRHRNANIARTVQLLPVVPLAEHRPDDDKEVVALADLAVTADARHLHLVQRSTGRRVELHIPHVLEAGVQTPPLARFLAEVSTVRCAVYCPFSFGAASRLPYLPRVRYRRTVLAPARWLLTATDLPARTAKLPQWEEALAAWRRRMRVPTRVALVELEQRLPLDLTHPVHRQLLRSRLDEAKRLELREAPEPDRHGWIGRAHEILLPLRRTHPQQSPPLPSPQLPIDVSDSRLPGAGMVLRAHLHSHPQRHDEILDRHLPALLAQFDQPPQWWFLRHREASRPEAGRHLALVLHLSDGAYGPAASAVHAWATALHHDGLIADLALTSYTPQTGRYGHGPALDAAHAVFAADSAAALAQIRFVAHHDALAAEALTAASLLNLATHLAPTADAGLNWLITHLPHEQGALDRTLREQTLAATEPGALQPFSKTAHGAAVNETWESRAASLAAYRRALVGQRDPLTVLRSLLHTHHIRALGPDSKAEALTLRLARTAALSHTARRTT
ncbi:lantibiotic dehydratase [Streptomyces lunalinharesii]|uniref:Lantibiotic dehydratase n=1 Tax=Streptomyces lunalinharesii TaxID=333384 RepID=A0ABN3RPG8_9ACTN